MSVHEFEKDYKAQLSLTSGKKIPQKPWEKKTLSQVFEEVVSWCINGQTEELKKAIDSLSEPSYKAIVFSTFKDAKTGYNIREIVAATGQVEVMKIIHADQAPYRPLYIGKALEYAISRDDFKMVSCIIERTIPHWAENFQNLNFS